jgi:hypothetical protein
MHPAGPHFLFGVLLLQGVLPARTSIHPCALLLVAWESYMTPSWLEYTKTPQHTVGCFYFFIEKFTESSFYYIKPKTRSNSNTFCEE